MLKVGIIELSIKELACWKSSELYVVLRFDEGLYRARALLISYLDGRMAYSLKTSYSGAPSVKVRN